MPKDLRSSAIINAKKIKEEALLAAAREAERNQDAQISKLIRERVLSILDEEDMGSPGAMMSGGAPPPMDDGLGGGMDIEEEPLAPVDSNAIKTVPLASVDDVDPRPHIAEDDKVEINLDNVIHKSENENEEDSLMDTPDMVKPIPDEDFMPPKDFSFSDDEMTQLSETVFSGLEVLSEFHARGEIPTNGKTRLLDEKAEDLAIDLVYDALGYERLDNQEHELILKSFAKSCGNIKKCQAVLEAALSDIPGADRRILESLLSDVEQVLPHLYESLSFAGDFEKSGASNAPDDEVYTKSAAKDAQEEWDDDFDPVQQRSIRTEPNDNDQHLHYISKDEHEEIVKEMAKEISAQMAKFISENNNLKNEIKEKNEKNDKLLSILEKTQILNSKLVYTNEALSNSSLNEQQKKIIADEIAKAKSQDESKILYESMVRAFSAAIPENSKRIPRNLTEAVQRGREIQARQINATKNKKNLNEGVAFDPENPEVIRMQKRAGIIKK